MGGEAARPPSLEPAASLPESEREPLVVVHVVAKPEAFANKSLESLLANNKIRIESDSQPNKSEISASGLAGPGGSGRADKVLPADDSKKRANDEFEVVLVDAPRSSIESCLNQLKGDSANYAGVEVEPPAISEGLERKTAKIDTGVESLRNYNRGTVAQAQKEAFHYYYDGAVEPGGMPADELSQQVPANQPESLQEREKVALSRGVARRLSPGDAEGAASRSRAFGAGPSGGRAPDAVRGMRRNSVDANNIQVLFVVSPERPAATTSGAEKSSK